MEFLEWDSQFFGVRVARLNDDSLTAQRVDLVSSWCQARSINCLYFLADPTDPETLRLAEDSGFRLVDARLELQTPVSPQSGAPDSANPPLVRPAVAADISRLRQIARENHGASRFYRDGNIPTELCRRLYERWLEKSFNGYAQAVFVVEHEGKPAGYLSGHVHQSTGRIGLLGVTAEARRKGLGLGLLQYSLGWFAEQRLDCVSVVTQGTNVAAVRLYEKAGFRILSLRLWYHKWFSKPSRIARSSATSPN